MPEHEYQILFNIVVGITGSFFGWLLNTTWKSLSDLQKSDTKLAEKVASIEVLVAGQYVTRDEFTSTMNSMFVKLDRIQDTLNTKVDKD